MVILGAYGYYHNKDESQKVNGVYQTASKPCSEIQEETKLAKNNGKSREVFAKMFRIGSTAFFTDDFSDVTFEEVFNLATVSLQLNQEWEQSDTQEKIEKAIHNCFNKDSSNRQVKVVMKDYFNEMFVAENYTISPV